MKTAQASLNFWCKTYEKGQNTPILAIKKPYVDSNESKICYINKNARIFGTTNYDDDSEYKIYLDSECTLELLPGTILDNTNALWIKKATE